MRIALMLFFLLTAGPAFATDGFETVIGGQDLDRGIFVNVIIEGCYTAMVTPGGGCVMTGHTSMNSSGQFDLLLVGVEEVED